MKLLFTGGHVTPALACIDEVKSRYPHVDIVFVGRKHATRRELKTTFEYNEITRRKIRFIHLSTGRLNRFINFESFRQLLHIIGGFWRAYFIVQNFKPDVILSFGGYIGLPIALSGFLQRIPVYIHEQTIYPGLGNRISSLFAKKVFVSFPETIGFFSGERVIITGNPVRRSIFQKKENLFTLEKKIPVIYVTGGSLGSHAINLLIAKCLPEILEHCVIFHQTGNIIEYQDFKKLQLLRTTLPSDLRERYIVKEHFFDDEIGTVYSLADLVVGRAGANTFAELAVLKKPALFIPLPYSAHAEQHKHAELFRQYGVGEVYRGRDPYELAKLIFYMLKKIDSYKSKFSQFPYARYQNAAEKILQVIMQT